MKDLNGLSASTKPFHGEAYLKLDVAKLRDAGLLVVNDRGKHVAIIPKSGRELAMWMLAKKTGDKNHKYTAGVRDAIVGVYKK